MPIYEFECESCGNEFERILSFSDSRVPDCPACESQNVVRQLGRPAIHFKGSGWYINDSKKVSKGSANGTSDGTADDASGGNGSSKETGGSDSDPKPAAKKETGASSAQEPAKSAAQTPGASAP